MLAIQQLRGEEIEPLPPVPTDDREKDLFELPDTHLRSQLVEDEYEDEDEIIENNELEPVTKRKQRTVWSEKRPVNNTNYHYALSKFEEMDDSTLMNLPVEMQHEILTDMKESLKRGQCQMEDMPQKSDDFSDYQIQKLLKQNAVSQKISTLNRAIKRQKFDIPTDSNAKVYAGKLASDASTQYVLIKSDTVQKPSSTTLSRTSSTTTPPSFSRNSTSDFSADKLMERDPVAGLKQRTSLTIPQESQVQTEQKTRDIERKEVELADEEESTAIELAIKKSLDEQTETRINNEEQAAIELAIERSLENQNNQEESTAVKESPEKNNGDDSSTDSDEADFIEVPTIVKPFELFFLLGDESQATKNNNSSSELIELENDESSHNSSIIEDLQAILENEKDQSLTTENTTMSSFSQIENSYIASQGSLDQLQAELISDTTVQLNTARGQERLTATLTDTMHEETQYLLRLFGIPYLVSPTEAEAQCAYLDLSHQCDGVITDDSDVWLFGGTHVYRHFFRQEQLVEYYDSNVIANQLGLDREAMIAIGMIVGSDYTKGIPNAGIITALEILQEFHGTCMERLEKFRHWWKKAQKPDYTTDSKVLKHLKNLELFEGFPNQAVYDAYQSPTIDYDQSKFTWAMPQLELLREFIGAKLKWDRRRIDDMILPVIKRMNTHEVQSRIDSFFAPLLFESTSNQLRKNTRLRSALDLLKEKTRQAKENTTNQVEQSSSDDEPFPTKEPKRTRKTTKLMNNVLDVAKNTKRRSKKKSDPVPPVLSDEE